MGEMFYFLLAEFENKDVASEVAEYAKNILMDLAEFNSDWQEIRVKTSIPVKERHKTLLERHPLVARYVKIPEPPEESDPSMNYLAGKCEMYRNFKILVYGKYVFLSCIVWQFASWDNVEEMFYRLGASRVVWANEEMVDYFSYMEAVIRNVKKRKTRSIEELRREILPLIIAVKISRPK